MVLQEASVWQKLEKISTAVHSAMENRGECVPEIPALKTPGRPSAKNWIILQRRTSKTPP